MTGYADVWHFRLTADPVSGSIACMETATTTTATTTYRVWVSDGSEVNEYGRAAAILDIHHPDGDMTPAAWTSEQVNVDRLRDEVTDRLEYGWEDALSAQVAQARAEAERREARPLDWTRTHDADGATVVEARA